jgi:hypothetical protein
LNRSRAASSWRAIRKTVHLRTLAPGKLVWIAPENCVRTRSFSSFFAMRNGRLKKTCLYLFSAQRLSNAAVFFSPLARFLR